MADPLEILRRALASERAGAPQRLDDPLLTTRWTVIELAKTPDADIRRLVVEYCYETYGRPVLSYVSHVMRQWHLPLDQAEDMTQGFFCWMVEKDSLGAVNRQRGGFRTFLKAALHNYMVSEMRKTTARKRRPESGCVSLGPEALAQIPDLTVNEEPLAEFERAWAAQILEDVLASVKEYYRAGGLESHWEVFWRRDVQPNLEGSCPPTLAQVCQELQISNPATASNMAATVRRMFKARLRARVRELVSSEEDVEGEIADMIHALSSNATKETGS